jgi:NADH:ubiquinone oxidoreductase subunit C
MSAKLERLCRQLKESFGDRIGEPVINHGEVTVAVPAANYLAVMRQLRDDPAFASSN